MDDWLKQIFNNLSEGKKHELFEAVSLASVLSVHELSAYLDIIPMTQTLFNGIADACIKRDNYSALFKLFYRYQSMANDYLGITEQKEHENHSGEFLA